MNNRYLLLFLTSILVLGLYGSTPESKTMKSEAGLPTSFRDLYHLSGIIVRGTLVDSNPQSDLIQVQVDEIYKVKCDETISIRRLELLKLNPVDDGQDSIFFLSKLGVIYTLPWGTIGVYHIIEDRVYNNAELSENGGVTPFKVNGLSLDEFLTTFLE